MGQSAGELFINLGLKGADKTIGGLVATNSAMSDLRSVSIETKAAILAVLYGVEKLVTTSGQLGTTLKNFSTISGVSSDTIQRYEFQARKAGVANESLRNSFLNVQESMLGIRAGEGLPKWMAAIVTSLAQRGVDLGPDFVARAQKDPTLAFQAMEKYAQIPDKDIDRSTKAITLQQAGWSPDVVTAMLRGVFDPKKIAAVPGAALLNGNEIDKLDALRSRWDSLIDEIETFLAKMTAKYLGDSTKGGGAKTREESEKRDRKVWADYLKGKSEADKKLYEYVVGRINAFATSHPIQVNTAVHLTSPEGKKTIKKSETHHQSNSKIISGQLSAQTSH